MKSLIISNIPVENLFYEKFLELKKKYIKLVNSGGLTKKYRRKSNNTTTSNGTNYFNANSTEAVKYPTFRKTPSNFSQQMSKIGLDNFANQMKM